MANNGYIALHRKFMDWEWYTDTNTKVVFIHLILIANHNDHNWRGITVKRGQTVATVNRIASEVGLTVQNVRTAIRHLEKTGELTKEVTNGLTVLNVVNYAKYQDTDSVANTQANNSTNKPLTNDQQTTNKPLTNHQQTPNKSLTTNKNDKNDKNEKNRLWGERKVASKQTPPPPPLEEVVDEIPKTNIPSFILDDGTEYQLTQAQYDLFVKAYPTVDVLAELQKIKVWCIANPSKRKTSKGAYRFVTSWLNRTMRDITQAKENAKVVSKPYWQKEEVLPKWYSQANDTNQDASVAETSMSDEETEELRKELEAMQQDLAYDYQDSLEF